MNKKLLTYLKEKPLEYAPSSKAFWNDEHISKYMLAAHLSPDEEGASRNHKFIEKSAHWIMSLLSPSNKKLLDLGCGPGLYAQHFAKAGFDVTGIDISKTSIGYALAAAGNLDIRYICQSYLEIEYKEEFDTALLIYCDYGVLSPDTRRTLLKKIHTSLRKGGTLIFDIFTSEFYKNFKEEVKIVSENEGFWSPVPYSCITRKFTYPENSVYLEQYIVITEEDCHCYNIWNQAFTIEKIKSELEEAGFSLTACYGDCTGAEFSSSSPTLCVYAVKN